MVGDLVRGQPQEAGRVLVEDVRLLLRGEKLYRLERVHGAPDGLRPHHLVRAEHDPLAQAGPQEALEVVQEGLVLDNPGDRGDVAIQLRVMV